MHCNKRVDECVEHNLKIERRAADQLEHVSSGGLLQMSARRNDCKGGNKLAGFGRRRKDLCWPSNTQCEICMVLAVRAQACHLAG